jgi:hypothetical protein
MKILFGVKKSRNIYGNNKEIKKVKTISLFSVRNIHIGVVSFFNIPENPSKNWDNYNYNWQ